MANPLTLKRRKKALENYAKDKRIKIPRGYSAAVPRMGKPARALLALVQPRLGLHPTGTWNTKTVDRLGPWFPKPSFGTAAVRAATSQLGVCEHPYGSNAGPGLTKYYKTGWGGTPNPYGWCTWFVAWCWQAALEARGSDVELGQQLAGVYMPNTGQVLAAAKRGNKHLRHVSTPKAGDWVCMFGGKHSGLFVRSLGLGYIQTIEGNTSSDSVGSQVNGGGVYRKTRRRSDVDGFVRYVA